MNTDQDDALQHTSCPFLGTINFYSTCKTTPKFSKTKPAPIAGTDNK
jgi:hypothetical protein